MKYLELAEVYDLLEKTSKRLEKTRIIAELLKKTGQDEIEQVMLLLQGRLYPAWDSRESGVAAQMMLKAIRSSTGIEIADVEREWKKTGDLGKTAENLIARKRQSTLYNQDLEITKVFDNLRKLSEMAGSGSAERKSQLIAELLTSSKPKEARYIVRTVLQQMRVGVGSGSIRDAIAWAYLPWVKGLFPEMDSTKEGRTLKIEKPDEINDVTKFDVIEASDNKTAREAYNKFINYVQEAYDLTNDFGEVAMAVRIYGLKGLGKIKIKIGVPVKAMLALKVDSIEEGFEKAGKPLQAEFKLDGFRVQIHKKGKDIQIFTRRLENVTTQFPDIKEYTLKYVKGDNLILDAEAAGYDPKTMRYLPFQKISQRIKRKYDIEKIAAEYPVEVNVFDIICHENRNTISDPFRERRKLIEEIIKPAERKIVPSKKLISSDQKEIEEFFKESKEKGNEGLMLKNLEAPYKPGSRVGYMLKYKKTMENLDLAIVKAEWGEGKRSKWLSSYTIACKKDDKLLEIGKASTGLKEKKEEGLSFGEMTQLLKPLIIREEGKTAIVKPKIIIEVAFEEIQKSPTYESGYALRFPRIIRLREDKGLNDVSTLKMIEQSYWEQKKSKK